MTGVRNVQRAQTRAKILAAAREHFRNRTYEEVGVREIATSAGIAAGTIIGTFGSKAGMLTALVIEDLEKTHALMEHIEADPNGPIENLMKMARACVQHQSMQLGFMRAAMADAWLRDGRADQKIKQAYLPMLKKFSAQFVLGKEQGVIRQDADEKLAALLFAECLLNAHRVMVYERQDVPGVLSALAARLNLMLRGLMNDHQAGSVFQPV